MNETILIGSRIKQLRSSLKMTQLSFANILSTTQASLSKYEKGDVQPPLDFLQNMKKEWPQTNLNWLITGEGEMTIDEIDRFNCPTETIDRIVAAISKAEVSSSGYHKLNTTLEEFIIRMTFSEKLTFPQSASFFGAIYSHFDRLKNLRLFARALREVKNKSNSLTPENSRNAMKDAIEQYKFTAVDKIDNLISEKQRNFLLKLVDTFDDIECFAILSDIDRAIEILEDEKLTAIDRFHIPILSSPVKL